MKKEHSEIKMRGLRTSISPIDDSVNDLEMNKEEIERYIEWQRNLRVKQLIEILQTFDPEAHIMIDNCITSTGQYLQQSMIDASHGSLIFVRVTV